MVSGIDQVIHFFFDDHDFDDTEIGISLLDANEVALVQGVRTALDTLLKKLPRGSDDDFVGHRFWPKVTDAARAAHQEIASR